MLCNVRQRSEATYLPLRRDLAEEVHAYDGEDEEQEGHQTEDVED